MVLNENFTFFVGFYKKKMKKSETKREKSCEKKNYAHKILKQTSKFEKYGHKE